MTVPEQCDMVHRDGDIILYSAVAVFVIQTINYHRYYCYQSERTQRVPLTLPYCSTFKKLLPKERPKRLSVFLFEHGQPLVTWKHRSATNESFPA